jgi:hypothetical protein
MAGIFQTNSDFLGIFVRKIFRHSGSTICPGAGHIPVFLFDLQPVGLIGIKKNRATFLKAAI